MRAIVPALIVLAAFGLLAGAPQTGPHYSAGGALLFPGAYRDWRFLSSGLGMTYAVPPADSAHPNFDNVFADPASYQAFLKTGTWPDKTVLILEVRASESKLSINQGGHIQTNLLRVEAHVKDAARGGWAFYAFEPGAARASVIPKTANCYSCHEQKGAADSTFVQFYPTLLEAARHHGTLRQVEH